MILVEESKIEEIKKSLEFFKKEFEKQNTKMLEFIDAIENTFKEERELDMEGFPTVDWEAVKENGENPESMLRNMVIDNIECSIISKIKKIQEKYK